jgi:predicted nucleic acid-binding protein
VIYLLDTGPLVSALARDEPRFGPWAKDLVRRLPRPFHTCEAVLTEAAHFLGSSEPVLGLALFCFWFAAGVGGG